MSELSESNWYSVSKHPESQVNGEFRNVARAVRMDRFGANSCVETTGASRLIFRVVLIRCDCYFFWCQALASNRLTEGPVQLVTGLTPGIDVLTFCSVVLRGGNCRLTGKHTPDLLGSCESFKLNLIWCSTHSTPDTPSTQPTPAPPQPPLGSGTGC